MSRYNDLYRVLREDEVGITTNGYLIVPGITAKNPGASVSVYDHVSNGSYGSSQYISTSASLDAARVFASRKSSGAVRIAWIKTKGLQVEYLDLTDDNVRSKYLSGKGDGNRAYNFARKFEEVLIIGHIPAEHIVLDWLTSADLN